MFDAVEIERRGIPTITICHDKFEKAAKLHAKIMGLPEVPLLIEPIPKGGSITFDTKELAKAHIDEVLRALVTDLSRNEVKGDHLN